MAANKILIVQTAFIGDVILITPLIKGTREIYPEATIDVLVTPQTAAVLENNPYLNDIIKFDKRKNKALSFYTTLLILRKKKYEITISPHSSLTTALLLKYAGIKRRIGFDRWSAAKYLTDRVPHTEGIHKTVKNLSLLSVLSDRNFSEQTQLFPNKQMYNHADELIRKTKLNTIDLIAIAPGSVWFTKRWPIKNYKQLIQKLLEYGYGIILIGSKEERELCNQIGIHNNLLNLSGELSLLESAAVIQKCDLMISNDSGALHIANAVKTDVYAFFGPTVKSIGYFPFRKNDVILEIDLDCRPCASHGGNSCPLKHHNCMNNIDPETIFNKIIERDHR